MIFHKVILYFRDHQQHEIDLLIEENNILYPIEIKKTSNINNLPRNLFKPLTSLNIAMGHGAVICFVDSLLPYNESADIVPVNFL